MKKIIVLIAFIGLTAMLAGAQSGSVSGTIKVDSPRNTVVYLESSKPAPLSTAKASLDQQSMAFTPHVLVVEAGATVEFVNSDSPMHNVMWPSIGGDKKQAKNLGSFPKGQKRSFRFEKPGVVPILCNVHPEMSAYIVVSPTPYHALIDNHLGSFAIANVPDGDYTLTVWHEGYKPQTRAIKVADSVKIDVTLTK